MTDRVVPYPGLRPFDEKDRAIFFGREAQMVSVLALLEEQQFVAVVGSSGSGKSSLILAGVIPAVREGFLRGTRNWKIVTLKPGSDPCGNLARALEREGMGQEPAVSSPKAAEPLRTTAEFGTPAMSFAGERDQTLVEKLHATDRSLIDLVTSSSASSPPVSETDGRGKFSDSSTLTSAPPEQPVGARVLIVVDQFEELFTFRRAEAEPGSEAARFAPRDEAATFVRLLLRACAEPEGRIAVIITMRSDFIGDCDAFLELPELISQCQFLVPRLNRSQLREAIERPGQVEDLGYAPFTFEEGLVNRIIAEAGDRLDQLPLMQHALMRTWKEAGGPEARPGSSLMLTSTQYERAGKISGALSKHADLAWETIKDDKDKAQLTRQLFLLLSDVHPDGKIVRRRPLLSEVQAITGASLLAIEDIVRLFQSDDRNFLLPPLKEGEHLAEDGHLDICHEALLRQWTEFGKWLVDEAESKTWLQQLSEAADDLAEDPKTELWHGNDLRGAEEWMKDARPSEPWARRHGVRNWNACLEFLELSRKREAEKERKIKEQEQQTHEDSERKRRQTTVVRITAFIAFISLLLTLAMIFVWQSAKRSGAEAKKAAAERLGVIQTLVGAAGPSISSGEAAVAEVERQRALLITAIEKAATETPPDLDRAAELQRADNTADAAIKAMESLANAIGDAAKTINDPDLRRLAENLQKNVLSTRQRHVDLHGDSETWKKIKASIETRLTTAEGQVARLPGENEDTRVLTKSLIRGGLQMVESIQKAALGLGFNADAYEPFSGRVAAIDKALSDAQTGTETVIVWKPENALASISYAGRVNRMRFAPIVPAGGPVLAAACENEQVWLWQQGGPPQGVLVGTKTTIADVAFSPRGDALAAASTGAVMLLRGTLESFKAGNLKVQTFARHSDSITDVEFSHGGQRIASGSVDRTVRVFDSRSMAQLYFTSPPLPDRVTSVAFHRGDNLVVSGCDDGGVRLHTIDQPPVQLLGKFAAAARWPEFSYDGRLVVAASPDKTARVWPISQPREIIRVNHPEKVTQATFRPVIDAKGYAFITTAANGEVRLVRFTDTASVSPDHPARVLEPRHAGAAVSALWSTDGRWLATVGEGEVIVWEWVIDLPVARLRITGLQPATSRAEFSPDGRLLVTYGADQIAYVWDLSKLPAAQ